MGNAQKNKKKVFNQVKMKIFEKFGDLQVEIFMSSKIFITYIFISLTRII